MRIKILLCLLFAGVFTNAQTINVVSNPSAPDLFAWSGTGALSGYAGNPVVLNNQLITQYNSTGISDPAIPVSNYSLQCTMEPVTS